MSSPAEADSWAYRPHLDGLRALAVYLVVAFHAGVGRASGGFVGVDVFFVLSGYLVTALLVRDLDGERGRVRFGRFYARRVRRLLPAAALNLVVTAIVFGVVAAPVELADARNAIRAAALYVANWYFILQSADYFAADVESSPVAHYWSLAVEEQFYLVWPVLLAGIYALARRRRVGPGRRVVQAAIALGAMASFGLARALTGPDISRAYQGTDTRAYQLLAGALLAVTPGIVIRIRRSRAAASLPAVAMILVIVAVVLASDAVDTDAVWRGLAITVVTVGLIVSLEAARGGPVRAVLSLAPVAYLGKISYSTYLWHWIVIVVLGREAEVGHVATAVIAAAVATGLASLSYELLEQPIRTASALDRRRSVVIAAGLVLSLVVGVVIVPRILDRATTATAASAIEARAGTTVSTGAAPSQPVLGAAIDDFYGFRGCEATNNEACTLTEGSGPTAMVVGESHAGMLTPMLQDLAERHDLRLTARFLPFCPWPRGVVYQGVRQCYAEQADLFDRIITEVDPDIVFLAHRPIDDVNDPQAIADEDEGGLDGDADRQAAALDRRITDVVRSLRADGRTVVIFEPIPVVAKDDDTLTCLSQEQALDPCRFVTRDGPGYEERIIRRLAADDDGVIAVDLDRLVCPYLPICDPVVDDLVVKRDHNHLTVTFARSLLDPVDDYLIARGVVG